MSTHREADLLEAMKYASLPEQRRLAAELEEIRAEAGFEVEADRDTDLANAIIEDHLTPVLVHGMHSTATDWLDEQVPDFTTADLHEIGTSMRAEASVWFATVTPGVKENHSELREQARGIARRLGSQYGSVANQAADIFLEYVGRLVQADGTDLAGVPSAAGDAGLEGGEDWSAGAPTLPVADAAPLSAPDGAGAPEAPEPSVSGPAPEEPTDTAPSATESLPVEDTHNDPGNAAATSEIPPVESSFTWESAQQRSIRQYLGTEEGQEFSVPGERDPEQDGEAASSLPVGVDVTGAPDSFPSFVAPTPSKPAPSTRAPQLQGSAAYTADRDPYSADAEGEDEHKRWPEQGELDPPTTSGSSQEHPHKRWPEAGENYPPTTSGSSQEHASSRHESVSTGPNPQGSFVYNPIEVEAKGYEEGFAYALTWSPGKPVPAALTSAATIGNKYNAEYVTGYRNGVGEGIATLSTEFQDAFKSAHKQQVLSTRRKLAKDHDFDCPKCGVHMNWNKEGTGDPEPVDGLCPDCADPYSDSKRGSRRTADANTRQFNDLDQEVAFPYAWRGGGGKGAADVASVPTPGSSVADYPQPNQVSTPAVGTEVTSTEPVLDTEDTVPEVVGGGGDPEKLASARRAVASRLGFSGGRQVTADDRPATEVWDDAFFRAKDGGASTDEAMEYADDYCS